MAPGGKAKRGAHEAESTKIAAFERRQKKHVHKQPIGVRAKKRQAAAARLHGNLKPMRFVSLHHHSTFSFMDGFQLPEAHVRRATEINMGAVAMTEHGNIFSHVKLEAAAEEQGIQPIFGCEFYVGWTDEKRRAQKKNHITVLAKNKTGYRNLLKLVNRSWSEGFYHEPTVDWAWLVKHQKGLIVLSGCSGSALFTALVGGKHVPEEEAGYERGLKVARWMDSRFDDLYIEVQAFPELEKTRRANPMLARIARQIGRPLVATMDCHYTAPEEAEIQKVLHSVRPGEQRTVEQMEQDWGYDVPLCPPPTDRAIWRRLVGTGLSRDEAIEAVVSTEEIAQECHGLSLPRLAQVEYPLPEGYDTPEELWRDWLKEGWKYRGIDRLPKKRREEYRKQLLHEMEIIEAKGFVSNILITADALRFLKEEQVPIGPARGSAAASLACYLLRITEVDPMEFPYLVFERFIDWSREENPDIDIDVATYGRPILRRYLEEKYGEGCVNNIGTFTAYKSKLALADVARVHEIPKGDVETIKELLIERSSGDLRASATIEDTVEQFDAAAEAFNKHPELALAMDLEGNYKAHSIHAAGLVISTKPITSVCSILKKEAPKGSGNWVDVISMDMKDAERQGMEKLDFLALSTMDMIAEAMYQLDMSVEDLYAIPFDDEETIQGFRENDVAGIFQFDGRATRSVNGVVKAEDIHEIALMVALSRPGPLHNGAVEGYANVKWGHGEAERIHPALDPITEFTNYQIVYQEQILRIVREIGGFDWEGAGEIRKIIAKKKGEQQFMKKWEQFRDGAKKTRGIDEETARRIWAMLTTSGAYAFNAAHSVSYGIISYWSMWLKRHHPSAFYAASLAKFKNDEKLAALRRDAVKHGIEVRPPALDSDASWRPEGEKAIRAGWTQISGIGDKMAEKIAAYVEEHGDFKEWKDLQNIRGVGPKTVEAIEAFVEAEDPFQIYKLEQSIESIKKDLPELGLPAPTHTCPEVIEEGGGKSIVFLAQPVKRNLRDLYEANAKKGLTVDPKKIRNPDLHQWLILTTQDADEQVTCIFSRTRYPKFKDMLFKMKIGGDELVLVKGKKAKDVDDQKSGVAAVFVNDIWVLEDD